MTYLPTDQGINRFIKFMAKVGFNLIDSDDGNKMFVMMDFQVL